ncbi:hypothetical protein B0H13DRAFT_1905741 [Mycena leptocephala]|nr:hypothetical protein B0H13DRAFT_1905741 [Mycena leptocephala]
MSSKNGEYWNSTQSCNGEKRLESREEETYVSTQNSMRPLGPDLEQTEYTRSVSNLSLKSPAESLISSSTIDQASSIYYMSLVTAYMYHFLRLKYKLALLWPDIVSDVFNMIMAQDSLKRAVRAVRCSSERKKNLGSERCMAQARFERAPLAEIKCQHRREDLDLVLAYADSQQRKAFTSCTSISPTRQLSAQIIRDQFLDCRK